jgi:hypothetical protein
MKTHRTSSGTAPLIQELGGSEWPASHPDRIATEKVPRYPLNSKQRRSGRFGEQTDLFFVSGFEPQTVQPVAESLYRLRYSGAGIYFQSSLVT